MKNCISIARFAVLPLACAMVSQALAQSNLSDVVVTANRSAQLLTDALPHTTVIGRELIERSGAIDLPSLLASEAGFQFTQNGGRGMSSSLFVRGSASLQVLVLIDGVPLTKQDTTGAVSIEHIMLDQIERVEIVRGNVSAIYGSGAIGGVIQVFTRSGNGKPSGYVQTEVGSYGSARVASGASGQFGDTRWLFGVGRHKSSGFSAINTTLRPNDNPDADGYRNTNYNLALQHELIKGHTLGLKSNGSDGRFDFDGGETTDVFKGQTKLESTALYSHNQIKGDWRSEVTFSEGRERSLYDATLTKFPYDSEAVTRTQTLSVIQLVAVDSWLVIAGAEQQNQRIDATDSYATALNRKRGVTAYFWGLSNKLGMNSVQFNVRHDDAEGLAGKTTGYAGYGYQITPAFKLITSLSSAFNLPPLGYLFDLYSGNPNLKPESARSKELGFQWANGTEVIRATYFDTQTKDQLLYNFDTFKFGNISSASNTGLEVSYSGKWAGSDMRGSLTFQDPVNESTGQQLVRRPRVMASVGAYKPFGKLSIGVDLIYAGARPDTATNPKLGAYAVANLSTRYTLTPQLAITSRVVNLLDRSYQTAYGYNQPGRSLYVGAVWALK